MRPTCALPTLAGEGTQACLTVWFGFRGAQVLLWLQGHKQIPSDDTDLKETTENYLATMVDFGKTPSAYVDFSAFT